MPTAQCMKNIESQSPPYNRSCSAEFCRKTSFARGKHCDDEKKAVDTPVIGWDETIPPIGGDDYTCYCCCSCYALNTPIEASKGEFVLIQNIQAGDSVMTAGVDLKWTASVVKDRSGDITTSLVPGLYHVKYQMPDEKDGRDMLVTPDHLFLMFSSKTLKKVQHLIPGNKLTTSDGKAAVVMFVAHGQYETAIQSITMTGDFDGKNLTGHLLNANGIVSTDYTVQVFYDTNNLDDKNIFKFSDQAAVYEVGSKEYSKQFNSAQLDAYLSSPDNWPKGFNPKRNKLVNIPMGAKSLLTSEQAENVYDNSEFNAYSNGVPRDIINKLFRIFTSRTNTVNFILDWNNDDVNAFAWSQGAQDYVLLAGGLARVKGLYLEGFALIISEMLTRLLKKPCVAEADYASFNYLREIYPDAIYAPMAPKGIRQLTTQLFDKIDPKNSAGNPHDVCDDPAIACRIEALWNGLSLFDMPKCGVPVGQYFYLKNAYASFDLKSVNVVFDVPVDPATALSLANYSIEPGVVVAGAEVSADAPTTVMLSVTGLKPDSKYILSVTNVTSEDMQSLGEGAYLVLVTP